MRVVEALIQVVPYLPSSGRQLEEAGVAANETDSLRKAKDSLAASLEEALAAAEATREAHGVALERVGAQLSAA